MVQLVPLLDTQSSTASVVQELGTNQSLTDKQARTNTDYCRRVPVR